MRDDLRQFDMECIEGVRQAMEAKYHGRIPNRSFLDELEQMLSVVTVSGEWVKKPKKGIVKGDVWECPIGSFQHNHTMHRFTYLYAEYDPDQEVVIDFHGHEEKLKDGKRVKKIKEWYFFPDGKVEFCDKDKLHQLINDYGKPIYVISVKVMSHHGTY